MNINVLCVGKLCSGLASVLPISKEYSNVRTNYIQMIPTSVGVYTHKKMADKNEQESTAR